MTNIANEYMTKLLVELNLNNFYGKYMTSQAQETHFMANFVDW